MDFAELFSAALASLPEPVRRRLDGGAPLDWAALDDPATRRRLDEANRACRRLPEPVETLVQRLIGDVGVVPADIVDGVERERVAGAWIDRVSIEADGETYRMRNRLSGEIHTGIRPEIVAGYAVLALELAGAVHRAGERWVEAGDRYRAAPAVTLCPLSQCAVRMSTHLRAAPESATTAILAEILETAWNNQDLRLRGELSAAIRPSGAGDARAPRRRLLAPATSYRLHASDPDEIRWLCALAERAGRGAPRAPDPEDKPADRAVGDDRRAPQQAHPRAIGPVRRARPRPDPDRRDLDEELAVLDRLVQPREGWVGPEERTAPPRVSGEETVSLDMSALEARIGAETGGRLELGSEPDGLALVEEFAGLERSASRLPGAVRRRMASAYGVNAMQALARLQDSREVDAVRAELMAAKAGGRAPRSLEDLAATLLVDAGAQTRDGMRTASLRLDPEEGPEGGYLATDKETAAQARLSLAGLVGQMNLSLTFARGAWTALTVLHSAGKESGWALHEGTDGSAELAPGERETLEAAQQIGYALDRIRDARSHPHHASSALEQAAMAADALVTVGPTVRAAAGWPGAAEAPNPRNYDDVTRVATVAEALQGDVRAISNRLIVLQMGGLKAHPEEQKA